MACGMRIWRNRSTATAPHPHFRSVNLDPSGDATQGVGESPSEAEAYMGMSGTVSPGLHFLATALVWAEGRGLQRRELATDFRAFAMRFAFN